MKARNSASIALLFALAPGLAAAVDTRPLQLELPALTARPAVPAARAERPLFAARSAERPERVAPLFHRNGSRAQNGARAQLEARAQNIGMQALESVLDPTAQAALDDRRSEGRLQLKFQKQGNAFRDLSRSYREMCDRVSAKVWDDPNGKRVRFDVAGKPGIGIEIPVGHKKR